jgi:hypothetical protein
MVTYKITKTKGGFTMTHQDHLQDLIIRHADLKKKYEVLFNTMKALSVNGFKVPLDQWQTIARQTISEMSK